MAVDTLSGAELQDTDLDTVPDYRDNCAEEANADQRDTDAGGIVNICDPEVNSNGLVDPFNLPLFKAVFGSRSAPDQDLNGNGLVDPFDLSILESFIVMPPGPACSRQ